VKFLYVNSCSSFTRNHVAYMNCVILKIYVVGFLTVTFIKFVWPYCCTYLLLPEGKSQISLERRYTCAIEKALVGKAVSLRGSRCGVCISSMRSGRDDMVGDLLKGTVRVPLRKLSLEEGDMFTRHFKIVLIVFLICFILVKLFGVLTRRFIF